LPAAIELAGELAALPQNCLRSDRRSSYEQWGMGLDEALANETRLGLETMATGETYAGASRFAAGAGRHGQSATAPSDG
jgi:enoyl-CoA hydratase